jgi:WD40 repeat protein
MLILGHDWVLCVSFDNEGKRLIVGDAGGYVTFVKDMEIQGKMKGHKGFISSVGFEPMGGKRSFSAGKDGQIKIWNNMSCERNLSGH